jgi:hypothetical protein
MILWRKILNTFFIAAFGGFSISAAGVANGPMRGWTPMQYVKDMQVGWNLGNTMDAWAIPKGNYILELQTGMNNFTKNIILF